MSENGKSVAADWLASGGEMGKLIRSMDWSQTPLGPIEGWSPSLRTTVNLCLASNFPINIIWGPGRVQIYNDGYWPICGDKHPHSMGQDYKECWLSAWDAVGEPYESAIAGETAFIENCRMFLDRNGYLEEAFFTFSLSPIRDETGGVGGVFHPVTEITQQTLAERRLKVLRDLIEHTANTRTIAEACRLSAEALADHDLDLPFTLFYQFDPDSNQAHLMGTTGLKPGGAACPTTVNLGASPDLWALADVMQTAAAQGALGQARQMDDLDQQFGSLECGPYPESPKSAIVVPIALPGLAHPWGVFVAGVSSRRTLDEPYQTFYTLLGKAVTTAIANAYIYEQERKRAEVLAELDRAKTTFFSNVSHEFRTPLTLLLGPLEDALVSLKTWESEGVNDDPPTPLPLDPSTLKQQLQLAHRNGLRLLKLVNTLLDFSRIESVYPERGTASQPISAVYEPTDLATLTAELASVFRSAIEQAKLRFVVDCPPLPEPVYVDREMWEKIVFNLISNAFKFTLMGEIQVSLRVEEWRSGGVAESPSLPLPLSPYAILEVRDTGIGIPTTEIGHLFEQFYRVKGAQGRSIEGSGIGLSLVQELVKLHGGTVQVSSVEGEGSCFRVFIPMGCAHLSTEQIGTGMGEFNQDATGRSQNSMANLPLHSTAMRASPYVEEALRWLPQEGHGEWGMGNGGRSTPTSNSSRLTSDQPSRPTHSPVPLSTSSRILLVDDNADMRDYLKRLLTQRWQVETAANGAIALEMIQRQLPDLILTDVMMPEMDGFQLLNALRADPTTQSIPVILLSARAGEEATVEGLEAGADDYLIKPFFARELMARVETQLQMSQLRQELSSNRFKNEFLMTVTHELQSPLATILGWARFLQTKSFDPDTLARALATIERNATIEAKLIKDLLDVASILSGKLRLKSQVVDLASLVRNVTATFRAAAQAKHLQLVETISDEVPTNVVADGDRLKQVIANLLENAIKFTPKDGRVEIGLSWVTGHSSLVEDQITNDKGLMTNYVRIAISDTGIGIHPDFLPYVFDRFTQAEVPSRHTPGGVGIGLAIAHHIVALHNGTIHAESAGEGQGTTFVVRLPVALDCGSEETKIYIHGRS
ncbi:response regulator [Oscillatoria sp. FACHB-1407]|uniref:ATP-binding response regulator n=1 Tax=Oscillatoria sp. FACHB-1407 TaxID=2692847 RepID=UPI0016834A73|nr:ATP-binding protein [Oscillatoria sp. FACHB-1407]MBD2463607.1 response regulator [Oscillatoria sp. FACHB-1407]